MEQGENGRLASLAHSRTLINDRNLLTHPCQSFEDNRGELKWVKKTQSLHIFCCQSEAKSERDRLEEELYRFVHPADWITHRLHLITISLFPLRSSPPPPGPFCLCLSTFNYVLTTA